MCVRRGSGLRLEHRRQRDRLAEPDEHLALEAGRIEKRVVEVEDDRARQGHAQRAPGSFAG